MSRPPAATAAATGEFLHDLLLDPARHAPGRPAVIEPAAPGGTTVTTYAELARAVDAYATALRALEFEPGTRVLLEAEAGAEAIAVLLACSRAGLTFVPIAPDTPQERLRTLVGTARPALHLQAKTGERTDLPPGLGTARFAAGELVVERTPAATARRRRVPCVTDPAYIVFTSGTTGRPKGVVMSHRAVTAFYRGMLAHRLAAPGDRIAGTSPLHFDFSLLTIGLALASGAAVVPVPQRAVRWPRRFLRALHDTGATHVNGVPSIWRQVLRHEPDRLAGLATLRQVLFCGEEFPLPELRRLQELRPGMRIVNCYGATESMAASFEDVPDPLPADLERLSIGTAHPGAEMILVDEAGGVVDGPGAHGEILLRSPALFTGYWDDPEATRAALVPDPLCPESGQRVLRTGDLAVRGENGELYFLGRTDSQVQINGNRVELGEVERRLLQHPAATAAAVLRRPSPEGGSCLAAFVVLAPDALRTGAATTNSASAAEPAAPDQDIAPLLRAFCARTLPSYMVPAEVRVVPTLPLTANGKADRAALAASLTDPEGAAR
ncbi:amino acid adenylation domain-containing protein [Streptomyces sp. NPDC085932]|uniref:amino acid adenylation domain-containing protein n=1 Tax=Streptomyces sp. NPDC085932 TaxID=3365741 RepID=UPI0037D008C9